MNDLIIASVVLGGLTLSAFLSGLWIGRRGDSRQQWLSEGIAVLLLGGYLLTLWNRPLLVRLLPTSNLIILANWLPLWGSFFVGIYAVSTKVASRRRVVLTLMMVGLSAYSGIAPLLGQPPKCQPPVTVSELHFQTTPYTCSPASAATVLSLCGIPATEEELSKLCLTRRGTHWLGLYRGLKLKTRGSEWTVAVEPYSTDAMTRDTDLPFVLSLNMDTSQFPEGSDHGFQDDMGHSVVFLKRNNPQCVTVFDPSPGFGVDVWDDRIFNCVEDGVILRLVPRDARSADVVHVTRRASQLAGSTLTAGL